MSDVRIQTVPDGDGPEAWKTPRSFVPCRQRQQRHIHLILSTSAATIQPKLSIPGNKGSIKQGHPQRQPHRLPCPALPQVANTHPWPRNSKQAETGSSTRVCFLGVLCRGQGRRGPCQTCSVHARSPLCCGTQLPSSCGRRRECGRQGQLSHIIMCLRRCKARWSEREKLRSQSEQRKGLMPVCFRKCRVSSSERANFQVQPSQVHL